MAEPTPLHERTEDARASGLLHFTLGGDPVELPVLRIRAAREWKAKLDAADASGGTDLDHPIEVMLDLLVAYDVQGVLGGRDAIEDRATDREVYAAFSEVLAATFPFVRDSRAMMADDFARMVAVALLGRAASTNGRSADGDSPPTPSKRRSRTSSSSSSGTRRRSA